MFIKNEALIQGCGIVEFETAQQAADAINTLHDSTVSPFYAPLL